MPNNPWRSPERHSEPPTTGPVVPAMPDEERVAAVRLEERRIAAPTRREADRRLAAVVEGMPDAFLSLDADWRLTYANREAARLADMTPDALLGRDHWETWPETVGSEVERQYRRVAAERVPAHFEHFYPRAGIWHFIHVYPGEEGGVVLFYRDVTPEKAAEAKLRRAETTAALVRADLARLVELMPAAMYVARGPAHVFEVANQHWYRMAGKGPEEVIGRAAREAFPELETQGLFEALDRAYASGQSFHDPVMRAVFDTADGAGEHFLSVFYEPMIGHDGATDGVLVFATDVTELVRARHDAEVERRAAEVARARAEAAAERTARLQSATAALSAGSEASALARVMIEAGVAALGAAAGFVAQVCDDGRALEQIAALNYTSEFTASWRKLPLNSAAPVTDAAASGRFTFLSSRGARDARYAVPGPAQFEAVAAGPLVVDGRTLGAWALHFTEAREFGEDDRALFVALSQQCAQALERARLFEAERAARTEAETARQTAEAANKAKSDFLAAMSHELRTPLNAIGGYVQLVDMGLRGPVTDEQRADFARIKRSQEHLLGLINDVLNFARLETGRVQFDYVRVRVNEALVAVEGLVAPQVAERRHRLEIAECDPDLTVWADPERLAQILVNLLSNAIKYTEPGGRITVRGDEVRDAARHTTWVRLTVSDDGIGIASDKIDSVFDPFVQVGRRLNRPTEGVGLGLAISRDLARAMGGELSAASEVGRGSTFTVLLPRDPHVPRG